MDANIPNIKSHVRYTLFFDQLKSFTENQSASVDIHLYMTHMTELYMTEFYMIESHMTELYMTLYVW